LQVKVEPHPRDIYKNLLLNQPVKTQVKPKLFAPAMKDENEMPTKEELERKQQKRKKLNQRKKKQRAEKKKR